ncbi:hypothetical protein [Candidatus Manganitrophus noduliformans]|uniref:Uncharacterized protein n=1 Tax=Candidatus Manganitrophus noduliformans TaxID=2606439 RepID=A0A7X6DN60_9BACT|nr:hypothetical protein [Candidatus Manganitrophus noduliformans]NKE69993.1 hypothetical protein [Candidatus Manganitrophus noduliformans]
MRRPGKHLILLTTLLLIIFSIGTVYDPCAAEWRLESVSPSGPFSLSEGSADSSRSSDVETADCHCLCHFSFRPAMEIGFERSIANQPLLSTFKEFAKAPPIDGLLRPPILRL